MNKIICLLRMKLMHLANIRAECEQLRNYKQPTQKLKVYLAQNSVQHGRAAEARKTPPTQQAVVQKRRVYAPVNPNPRSLHSRKMASSTKSSGAAKSSESAERGCNRVGPLDPSPDRAKMRWGQVAAQGPRGSHRQN